MKQGGILDYNPEASISANGTSMKSLENSVTSVHTDKADITSSTGLDNYWPIAEHLIYPFDLLHFVCGSSPATSKTG